MRIVEQSAEIFNITEDSEKTLEEIARISHSSEHKMDCDCIHGFCDSCVKRRRKFLSHLKNMGHDSIFEHASATFKIVTDRGVSHELVRHRMASYTQASTRYIKYDQGFDVIKPIGMSLLEEGVWIRSIENVEKAYSWDIEDGVPLDRSRDILPVCIATRLFMTANFREWRHILKLRLAKGSHPKMRELAKLILQLLRLNCPVYFEDLCE